MVRLFINNKVVFVPKNSSILEACEELNILIPRFCYHERLNVAGNCRMCLVEVEKTPKPVTSCAFPVVSDMRVYTDTPLVQKARENILEFLLINHPLDCPICDQGGECDLQEQSLAFGTDRTRFFFTKRSVEDKSCGPLIKTIMTRCIHCTRCVRFFQDVVGDINFGTTLRGQETEIGAYIESNLNSELSGNIIDLCPVGALTSKPYAFMARPWEITSTETIDITDSVGSNIRVDTKETEVLRILPLLNDNLNEEWISDKTRFSFDGLKLQRIGNPFIKSKESFLKLFSWQKALNLFKETQQAVKPSEILVIAGNSLDLKSFQNLNTISKNLSIDLISEQFLDLDTKLMSNTLFNTTFNDFLDSDLCLSVGTNVRFEASLLNVRLKKCIKKGNFIKASVGLNDNYSYKNDSIGNSIKTLISIAEGKHSFCKHLVKSKKPSIIIGSSVRKRLDSTYLDSITTLIARHTNVLSKDWYGLNFLPLHAGSVGNSLVNIKSKSLFNLKNKKFVFCVGLDSYKEVFKKLSKDAFVVAQTPYSDSCLKETSLILPSTSFLEKESIFINLEGRLQKTAPSLKGLNLARNDSQILKILFASHFKTKLQVEKNIISLFKKNKYSFTKNLIFKKQQTYKKFFKTSFKASLKNFFMTNSFTKNSLVMAKCSLALKQNYSNFV